MKMKLSCGCKTDEFAVEDSTRSAAASSRELGRRETFFDTQPWLESDCDDDFFSVGGDFTPSRANTPLQRSISMGNPPVNNAPFEERAPKRIHTSLKSKKKKLVELFRDSSRGYKDGLRINSSDQNTGNGNKESRATLKGSHSEKRPNHGAKHSRERAVQSAQCCLPTLSSSCT